MIDYHESLYKPEKSDMDVNALVEDGEELYEDPEDCDNCPEIISTVSFDLQKWHELQHIKEIQKGKEFAVYLLGDFNAKGIPEINDYYIPEQEVSATLATITEEELPEEISHRIIGHLHSHHSMGFNPSGTDIHHLNYPVHIIISNSGESCTVRKKAECGRILKRSAEIQLTYNISGIQGLDKIKPMTFQYQYQGVNQAWKNQPKRIWKNGKWQDAETQKTPYQEYDEDIWETMYRNKEMTPAQKLPAGME